MIQTVQLEIVSPEKLLFSEHVEMVVLPSTEGDFGVLINHAPLLAIIRPGVATIYRGGQIIERIFISGGFVEVTATTVTVLAEEALILNSMEQEEVERRLAAALELLKSSDTPDNRVKDKTKVAVAEAMLSAMSLST